MTTDHEIAPKELEAAIQAHIQTCRLGAGVENREETVRAVITAYLNARGSRPDRASYNAGFEFGIQVSTVFQEEVAERIGCAKEAIKVETLTAVIKELRAEEAKYERRIQNADIHRIGARIDEIRLDKIREVLAPFAKKGG